MSILTLEIQDEWFYLMGNLGTPFWISEAFTMQILTPEREMSGSILWAILRLVFLDEWCIQIVREVLLMLFILQR